MNKKILLIIACVLSVCMLIISTIRTYALFESTGTGEASSRLANWKIKINNTNIVNLTETNRTFNLGSVNWTNQNHVKAGKGAPGSIGTLHIIIDPDDTEVSFTYELTFDLTALNNSEFQIHSISETSGETLIRTGENTYTGIAYLNDIQNNKEYDIEIQFIWNNSVLNDEDDYELGRRAGEDINIPIAIRAKQYIGEEIEEYREPTNNENNNEEENENQQG